MAQTTFDRRITRIEERSRLLSDGASYRVGPDGLIIAQPHRRYAPHFPVKGILLLLLLGFAYKAFLFTASGEATYTSRLSELAEGRAVERMAAWVMQPDPATRAVAAAVAKVSDLASDAAQTDIP